MKCWACRAPIGRIAEALRIPVAAFFPGWLDGKKPVRRRQLNIVERYPYCDEHGEILYEAVRLEPKDFRQRRVGPDGRWVWNVEGVRLVPYRLPDLLAAAVKRRVFVVEGERKADALWSLDVPATCNVGGAGKWLEDYSEFLRGRRVVILPDNDEAGRRHAIQVAGSLLLRGAASISVAELPGLPPKGDVVDWLRALPASMSPADRRWELFRVVDAAPVWQPFRSAANGEESRRASA